eukprot:TRINITY_DN67947_c0_g1_i1.p1 TRINITY_DN67947_c0_g1~~TRINITY_DN67947_c0_g1_i1.p1  ORF type:complete len:427 (+),score=98.81 TRINITY_DN67947_c0_g1_i1:43-1281(+)
MEGAAPEEDAAAEEIPSHLECAICMKLLLEPVSVPCGHTFCRGCLEQSLGYRNLCAVCRAPVPAGSAVNILIRNMISAQYPRALANRRREVEEEQREAERSAEAERQQEARGSATQEDGTAGRAPILPVLRRPELLLPSSRVGFDLTSPEEESLVNYALQGGRRLCVLSRDSDVGICMNVENLRPSAPPGAPPRPAHVFLAGKFRVRLAEPPQLHEDGFELARSEAFFDTPLPITQLQLGGDEQPITDTPGEEQGLDQREESVPGLATKAMDLVEQRLEAMGPASRHVFLQHCGEAPTVLRSRQGSTTSAAMEQLSFWLLGAIKMDESQRRRWLESTDTRGRLEECQGKLKTAGARLNLPGSDSFMHPEASSLSSLLLLLAIIGLLAAKALGLFDSWGKSGRQAALNRAYYG